MQGLLKRVEEAEKALDIERQTRAKLIADEGRRDYAIPYHEKCRELEVLTAGQSQLVKQNAQFARMVKALQTEKTSAVQKCADLTGARASLAGKVAAHARKDAVAARAAATRSAANQRAIRQAEARAAEAEMRAEKAEEERQAVEKAARERVAVEEAAVADAEQREAEAREDAVNATEEAMLEVEDATSNKVDAEYALMLALRREERAKAAAAKLEQQKADAVPLPASRTEEEWATLRDGARWKAAQRDRDYLRYMFNGHAFRMNDLACVLAEFNLLDKLMDTPDMFAIYFQRVKELLVSCEQNHFGLEFALVLHYDLHLTPPKILEVTQAGCKVFNKKLNNYKSKVLLHNPYLKNTTISVPRIAPPLSRLVPTIRHIEAQLGIQHNSDGTIAYASFQDVVKLMMMQDPGTHDMPTSSSFLGGPLKLPIIIKYDATGFGTLQLTTLALHNPYMPQAAQQLRILGLGKVGDDRGGVTKLMGPNLEPINKAITNGTTKTLGSSSSKLSLSQSDYDPRTDTCVAALARKIREISSV